MPELTFPLTRFREAGGTDIELDQLIGEFERSDFGAQQSLSDLFASISEGGIREYLGRLRDEGHFNPPVVISQSSETEPIEAESLAAVPDPVPIRGATTKVVETTGADETEDAPVSE